MGIRYYKLFDLLNRKGMKKSDLRKIISSATVAKLSKGEYISGEAIEKICIFLECQPGDIMEIVEMENSKEILKEQIEAIKKPQKGIFKESFERGKKYEQAKNREKVEKIKGKPETENQPLN